MRKIIIALLFALVPVSAYASTSTKITNFTVGTCKTINGGLWQQLSDGTWADPNDSINTCNGNSSLLGLGSSSLNLSNLSNLSGLTSLLSNNNASTLGTTSQANWIRQCLLTQSILPQSQCQGLSYLLNSGLLNNNSSSLSNLLAYAQLGTATNSFYYANNGLAVSATFPQSSSSSNSKFASLALGFLTGWGLNQMFN